MARIVDGRPSLRSEDVIGGVGIWVGAMQSVARRQVAGSVVAFVLIVTAAGTALRSSHEDETYPMARAIRGVQQPAFVTSADGFTLAVKSKIQVP
jgi:hypothetical protein